MLHLQQINRNNPNRSIEKNKEGKKVSRTSVTSTKISNDIKYIQLRFQKKMREWEKIYIFEEIMASYLKFGEIPQPTDPRNSTKPKKSKGKKNNTQAHHFQTPDYQILTIQ